MKQDRRIVKTKKAIRDALISLLENKALKEITVTDICYLADINRKTFYNNYTGIDQLIEEIEDEIVSSFETQILAKEQGSFLNNPQVFFELMTETIRVNYAYYTQLISLDYAGGLIDKFKNSLKHKVKEFMVKSERFDLKRIDWLSSYVSSGVLGLYQDILNHQLDINTPEVAKMLKEMVMSGVNPFMTTPENQ